MSNRDAAASRTEAPGHYCWIRVVNVRTAAVRTADRVKVVPKRLIKDEKRPPPTISAIGTIPNSSQREGWTAIEEYFGRDDVETVFEYGPAFYYLSEAEAWITTPNGIKWDAAADNRMLMSFTGSFQIDSLLAESPCTVQPGGSVESFPDECWDPALSYRWKTKEEPGGRGEQNAPFKTQFLGQDVNLEPADDYRQQPPKVLYGPAVGNDPAKDPLELHVEAHGAARVIAALFQEAGLNLDGPPVNLALKRARTELMNEVERVIYALKVRYNRPRPWMVFPELKPVFAGDDWRNPRHPAYPSGHAVTAALWATLLAEKYPRKAEGLNDLAKAIAQRRVDAGLHFQGDCDDGLNLGRWLAHVVIERVEQGSPPDELPLFATAYKNLP